MYKNTKVGPYLMYVFKLIMLYHHFHTHLAPGWHTHDITNIPVFGMLYYFIQFLIPVFHRGNATAGFIKCLEPERTFFCQYPTQITGIPTSCTLLQISGSAQHQKP